MIGLLVLSVVVAVVVGLICVGLLGPLIKALPGPFAGAVGGFLSQYGWVLGVLAGLWYFFTNGKLF